MATPPVNYVAIAVLTPNDVEHVRREARALARRLCFSGEAVEEVTVAASELAMNLLRHAQQGVMRIHAAQDRNRVGLKIESVDHGPGILDLDSAMTDGFSTAGGLGSGLPAARRLMDDFAIETGAKGTRIVTHKWQSRLP